MNIVFVCTGNTCRSPLAEGFMKKKFELDKKSGIVVSRGISVVPGSCASDFAIEVAGEYGVEIDSHRAMNISIEDLKNADYVFTVTSSHKSIVSELFPEYSERVYALSDITKCGDVSDPYGGSVEDYRIAARQIFEAVNIIYEKIVDKDGN